MVGNFGLIFLLFLFLVQSALLVCAILGHPAQRSQVFAAASPPLPRHRWHGAGPASPITVPSQAATSWDGDDLPQCAHTLFSSSSSSLPHLSRYKKNRGEDNPFSP